MATNHGGPAGMAPPSNAAMTSSGGGGWWMDLLNDWGEPLANIAGAALSAGIANQGADGYADAVRGANTEAVNLTRDIYRDQTARSEPWRQSGVNALNFQNLWLGMPQVSNMGGSGMAGGQAPLPNLGAGQPVAGHSGGFGGNPMASGIGRAAGSGIGSIFGPVGSAIGGELGSMAGGLFRQGGAEGDRWTTLATQAPGGMDYERYWNENPDLATASNGWSKPDVQALFGGNRDAYINWHYNNFGKTEGRQLHAAGANTTQPGAAGAQPTQAATPDLWSTIRNNPLYVAATDGFLGVDKPEIDAAYATGGQVMSGAQKKALHDRGVARSYNALGDIWNQYGTLSGTGQTAVGQQNAAGGQFGASAAPIIRDSGEAAGRASATRNANWANAAGNAVSGLYDWGKSKGWI
jgi:hypothetical protein